MNIFTLIFMCIFFFNLGYMFSCIKNARLIDGAKKKIKYVNVSNRKNYEKGYRSGINSKF